LRKKILFVAEAVALAHVSRPLVLARAAQQTGHDVVFATDERDHWLLRDDTLAVRSIHSMSPQRFLGAIARGSPLIDYATLRAGVDEDLRLIESVRPDLVIGDLRLSLSVSARLAKVPYVAICNAYWSPFWRDAQFDAPPLAATRLVPLRAANALFQLVRPLAFAWHARPLNRVRREFGLTALPLDMRYVYTDADHVLYADAAEMFPLRNAPSTHRFLGPVIWSPPTERPAWWHRIAQDRPIIYVTLGSTGDPRQLPAITATLAKRSVCVMVATARRIDPGALPSNVFSAAYLPGDAAARMAALVICNGGAPTSQQALAAGVPVLGIATNLDQVLNMQAVTRTDAGLALRGDRTSAADVDRAAGRIMNDASFTTAAGTVATTFARYDTTARLGAFLSELFE